MGVMFTNLANYGAPCTNSTFFNGEPGYDKDSNSHKNDETDSQWQDTMRVGPIATRGPVSSPGLTSKLWITSCVTFVHLNAHLETKLLSFRTCIFSLDMNGKFNGRLNGILMEIHGYQWQWILMDIKWRLLDINGMILVLMHINSP